MIRLGLERISALIAHIPTPWPCIHVAGTNGKGSVCAYIDSMLTAVGIRTGRFNSPHLIHPYDAIHISNRPIPPSLYYTSYAHVLDLAREFSSRSTPFELLTATAAHIFTTAHDCPPPHSPSPSPLPILPIIETGLGGTHDATNALPCRKLATLITSLSHDHTPHLGHSIRSIAAAKAGIFRPGTPVLYDPASPAPAIEELRAQARKVASRTGTTGTPVLEPVPWSEGGGVPRELRDWVDDGGGYAGNVALAWAAVGVVLRNLEVQAEERVLLDAIKETRFPGRMQRVRIRVPPGSPAAAGLRVRLLLDGAHNPSAAEQLGARVDREVRGRSRRGRVGWVVGVSEGKDVERLVLGLGIRDGDRVACVRFGEVEGMEWVRGLEADRVRACLGNGVESRVFGRGIAHGIAWAGEMVEGQEVVVTGSLYLIGEVLRLIQDEKLELEER